MVIASHASAVQGSVWQGPPSPWSLHADWTWPWALTLVLAVALLHGCVIGFMWLKRDGPSPVASPDAISVSLLLDAAAAPTEPVHQEAASTRRAVSTPVSPVQPVLASDAAHQAAQAPTAPQLPKTSAVSKEQAPSPEPVVVRSAVVAASAVLPSSEHADVAKASASPQVLTGSAVRYLLEPVLSYPRVSLDLGESGTVLLKVLVDEQGRPRDVEVAKSSGFVRLDQQAVQAMLRARFQPHIEGGIPHPVWVMAPQTFKIQDQ